MTYDDFCELKQRVRMGEEFLIRYNGEDYWISQNAQGFYFTRVKDSSTQSFTSSDELFENASIGSKLIRHIWHEIDW